MTEKLRDLNMRLAVELDTARTCIAVLQRDNAQLRDDNKILTSNLDEERKAILKQGLDYIAAIEQNVNLRAARDALIEALVAAYRTRKPNG